MARGALLRHRDFRLLWAGESVSELGSQVSLLALPLLAVRVLRASTFEVAALSAASTAAFLLVGLPAGAIVDRLRRRRVMIAADVGRALLLASVPLAAVLGDLHLAQLYVVTFAVGVLTVFFDVAYQSCLPFLVPADDLVEGNAKLAGSAQVAQVAGPAIAGGLVQAVGAAYAVIADAVSFCASAAALGVLAAREPRPTTGLRRNLLADIGEGIRFVAREPLLRAIAATTATANFFGSLLTAVEVVFLVRAVHASPGEIGLLFGLGGVGGVAGALVASAVARRIGGARATLVGIALDVGVVLIPLTRPGAGLLLFAGGIFCTALGATVYNVNQVSFRQRLCPPPLLGRMNATMRFVVWGVMPIGGLLGGAVASAIGLRPTMWIAAIGESLAGGWLLASPMRGLRDFPSPPAPS